MLSFTHNSKSSAYNINQLDFQPLVISDKELSPLPLTKNPQKKIAKVVSQSRNIDRQRPNSRMASKKAKEHFPEPLIDRQGWQGGGKIQMFDGRVTKTQLADQERRLRAEAKKTKSDSVEKIVRNQKQVRNKTLKLQKEQQVQINKLKMMIEKERYEKEKNDKLYQAKVKEIEKERNDLMLLQRKIQQNGVKKQKQFKKQMKVLAKNEYPANDRGKCHQDIREVKKHQEITQSQINHQYNQLRQHQLQILTNQRERCLIQKPSLDYNPTIIPLLSRASYKIISTHISTLVELFIDDLLEEQVYMLEEIELQERAVKQKQRENNIINDYYQQLQDFVGEAEEIEGRVGRYTTMKFQDLYIPKRYDNYQKKSTNFKEFQEKKCILEGISQQAAEEIESRKDRQVRFLSDYDHYKKSNLTMFQQATEEIIDEAILKLAKELDRGSNDFVELIFRKQFE